VFVWEKREMKEYIFNTSLKLLKVRRYDFPKHVMIFTTDQSCFTLICMAIYRIIRTENRSAIVRKKGTGIIFRRKEEVTKV
jgi:hypothetical protein